MKKLELVRDDYGIYINHGFIKDLDIVKYIDKMPANRQEVFRERLGGFGPREILIESLRNNNLIWYTTHDYNVRTLTYKEAEKVMMEYL